MSKNASYEQLERAIIAWAQEQETVRAMLVVGSHARPDHPADEWSDLDLILFTNDPARYTTGPSWLEETGQVWLAVSGSTGCGDLELDVIYASGDKADWVIVSVAGCMQMSLPEWIAASPYSFVLERGLRILDDKTRPSEPSQGNISYSAPPVRAAYLAAVQPGRAGGAPGGCPR